MARFYTGIRLTVEAKDADDAEKFTDTLAQDLRDSISGVVEASWDNDFAEPADDLDEEEGFEETDPLSLYD